MQSSTAIEPDSTLEPQLREGKISLHFQRAAGFAYLVFNDGRFAVRRHPNGSFFRGRASEQIQAHVGSRNPRKELCFTPFSINAMRDRIVVSGFNRRPGRRPKRVHSATLVEDRRNVAAAFQHRYAQIGVFDAGRSPFAVDRQQRTCSHFPDFADFKTASVTQSVAKASRNPGDAGFP
jgi:hypothetical protein